MSISESEFWRSTRRFLVLLFLLALALPLAAQTGLGVIHGTVTDASHAVMANAKVTLTNTQTGVAQSVQTTDVGVFYFGSVRPGPYSVTVEFEHFKKWTGTLTLEVGQNAVVEPVMEVGSVDATVEVTGAAPIIETEKGSISDVKDAVRIHELPLNGRQITTLFTLTPGVEAGQGDANAGSPRTNGMKAGSTEMVLDGISLVDRFTGGMAQVQPGLDTVQEYRFETTGSDAQFSRPATVSLVTKSGTNEFHGSVFETHRNNYAGLRARQRMDNFSTPPKYIRNEYGASVGGPLVKNKIFWLFSYEGMKLRQQTYSQTQVPTDDIWNGNFAGAHDTNGQFTIYDPLSTNAQGVRTPFNNNQIPSSRLAPIGQVMKSISPGPNVAGVDPWVTPNFKVYYPQTQDYNTQTAKYDQVFSEKDNLSVRFTRSDQRNVQQGGRYGFPPPGCDDCGGSGLSTFGLTSVFVRENHVFTPTFMNEFQASVNRSPNHQGQLSDSTNWADKLGLPNPFGATGWPTIYTSDWWFMYWGGWDAGNPRDQKLTAYQIEDNVTWIKGTHTLQFGFRGRQELNNVREMQQAQGSHSFYGDWTALYDPAGDTATPYTGLGFASMELGLPTYLSNQFNRGYFYFRQKEVGLYFQDSWKVNSRLTVNYGIRWDKWTPYKEKFDRLVNFDPWSLGSGMQVVTPNSTALESIPGIPASVLSTWAARGLTWKTADQAGLPGALIPGISHDFGPRLGIAYRLSDRNVLRASYGMYYWPMPLSQILQSSRTNPPLNLRFQNSIGDLNGAQYNHAVMNVPAADEYVGAAIVSASSVGSGSQGFTPLDPNHWNDDRMQQWTVTYEREMGKNNALRLSYLGNHGSNLEQRWAFNDAMPVYNYRVSTGLLGNSNPDTRRANANWNGQAVLHNGYSNSNSLQAEFEHRTSHGLTFQAFYTWAHVLSTSDANGNSSGNGGINSSGAGTYLVPQNQELLGMPNLSDDQRLRLGYANSDQVPPHHLRWNGVYELPFGKGKKFGNQAGGVVNQLIGGWSVAFIGDKRSGFWMGVDPSLWMMGDPTLSKDQRITTDINGRQQQLYFRGFFNPAAAKTNQQAVLDLVPADPSQRVLTQLGSNNQIPVRLADGTVANTSVGGLVNWNARNFYQGPGSWNEDLSLYKTFAYRERYKLRFTADFFNFFNHPNSVNPNATTGLLDLSQQSNAPRIIQFSGRFEF